MALTGEELLDEEFGLLFDEMMKLAQFKINHMSLDNLIKLQEQIESVDDGSWYASNRIAPFIKPYVVGAIRHKQNMKNN